MSSTPGTSEQILSLPRGGGAVQGLGENFVPDLHTGTGSYAIPLDIPNGPNDIAPKLTLLYHTAAGNGPFGMGFSLPLYTIRRSTDKRIPTYRGEEDPLILVGGGEFLHVGGGKYRLRVDTSGWRIEREGNGFRLTDREGKYYRLGVTEQARLFTIEDGQQKILSWHLEEIEDPLGYKVKFAYQRDKNQLYLDHIDYSVYTVRFAYQERPDPLIDGRAGFLVTTRLRCTDIELLLNTAASSLTRRWELTYSQSLPGGHSLLHQVRLTGFDEAGQTASLPVLTLGYTAFFPRQLKRFEAEMPGTGPGTLTSGQREIVDWDGDGLPDLVEIGGGRARVWLNRGNGTWARPRTIGHLPAPVSLDRPGVAFADMEGNGTADLIMLNRPLAGYYPHLPKGGFDRPVFWRDAPSARLSDPDVRLVDLNNDGITDLLVTGASFFSLFYRQPDNGWQGRPQTIPRSQVPPVFLSDPRVHLADMNGDGLQDIVRMDGAGVRYWPYLGNGHWSAPVHMENSPVLPQNFEPRRLFLNDLDGDGCADLVYIDFDRVIYWLNQSGTRLSDPHEVLYTPPASVEHIRLADMQGNGTAGVFWSGLDLANRAGDSFYLDFTGGVKPYLLNRIDNGMGLVTEIEYDTSVNEVVRDRLDHHAWATFLPFPVPVISTLRVTDQVASCQSISKYRYHDGHYSGSDREFAGFSRVEIEEVGDEALPAKLTRNWYHIGLDPADPGRSLPELERNRLRSLRGKLLQATVYGLEGNPEQESAYMQTENTWGVAVLAEVSGEEVLAPRLQESRTLHFEKQSTLYRVTTVRNLAYDDFGNVTEQEQRAEAPDDPTLTQILHTITTFAHDADGRFGGKPARIIQREGNGQTVATTVSYYDGLAEGQIGIQGLLTRQESLVLTDDIVSRVYGDNPPDFASLGYHRHLGESGWWVNQVSYTRVADAAGLRGTITNARGNMTQIFFDSHHIHPVKVIDALGNAIEAVFDYRSNKLQSLTDANGATISNRYDPLGRLIQTVEPGGSDTQPTSRYTYKVDHLPVQLITEQRAVNGQPEVITRKAFLDGLGQVIEERTIGTQGEIVERSQLYSARKVIKSQFLPYIAAALNYTSPSANLPHSRFFYDALGRLIEVQNPDGSVQRQQFDSSFVYLYDEEDSRTDPEATHTGTPTRHTYDPTGRIMEVALNDGGRWLATRYKYDVKGNLLEVVNPVNQRTSLSYDLLGHRLRADNPGSGTSIFIFDAVGNQVEKRDARNETVRFEFDPLDRLQRVMFPTTGEVTTEYTYHDTNHPAPFTVGPFTKGRVAKIMHQGGEEILGYDALGRVIHKEIRPSATPAQKLVFDFTYRADGQRATVTYPEAAPASGRVQISYEYDLRGLLIRIPSYIRRIDYNLAGQRSRVEYANDVVTTYGYDSLTLRLEDLLTEGSAGEVLQHFHYRYDQVGNLLKVTSPDSKMATDYLYDDLYRLKEAATQSARNWTYHYDDQGNLTFKSDVGSYQYDTNGLLTSAGSDTFTYTLAGQTLQMQEGEFHYDPIGRLKSITRGNEQLLCTYDHDGRRVRMQAVGMASSQDLFTPNDLVTIENGVISGYILDGAVRVAQIKLGTPAVSFLHGDHLGSTTLVTGPAGQVLQQVYYDPFGTILENIVAPGVDGMRILYTGQLWDAWSGLLYLNTRYYNPRLGRFLTPDTIVPELFHPLAWNRYSYVQNNPLRFIDPSGHFWEEIGNWFKESWKYIVAAVAIVAVAILTVVTFGWGALIAVGIAMAVGGTVGGMGAAAAGGDILLGILVGMAVGGAAMLGGMGIGTGMTALFGAKTLAATLLTGTLAGAVNGAAMGFAAGFAGGQGSAGEIWEKIWQGALAGAIAGAVFGFGSYAFGQNWLGTGKLDFVFPKGADALKRIAIGFAAGSAAELGRQAAKGGNFDWGQILLAGVGGAGIGSMVKFGGNSGLSVLNILKPEYVGVVSSLFAQTTSAVFVLDYADDLWQLLKDKEAKVKYEGKWG